jgi:hypothetical protein
MVYHLCAYGYLLYIFPQLQSDMIKYQQHISSIIARDDNLVKK